MIGAIRDIAAFAAAVFIGVLNGILSGIVYLMLGIAGIIIRGRSTFGHWMKAVFDKGGKK